MTRSLLSVAQNRALLPLDLAALDQNNAQRIRSGIENDFQGLDGLIHNAAPSHRTGTSAERFP